jgi:hypothetical protein
MTEKEAVDLYVQQQAKEIRQRIREQLSKGVPHREAIRRVARALSHEANTHAAIHAVQHARDIDTNPKFSTLENFKKDNPQVKLTDNPELSEADLREAQEQDARDYLSGKNPAHKIVADKTDPHSECMMVREVNAKVVRLGSCLIPPGHHGLRAKLAKKACEWAKMMGFGMLISLACMNPDFTARPVDKQATLWKRLMNDGLPSCKTQSIASLGNWRCGLATGAASCEACAGPR